MIVTVVDEETVGASLNGKSTDGFVTATHYITVCLVFGRFEVISAPVTQMSGDRRVRHCKVFHHNWSVGQCHGQTHD